MSDDFRHHRAGRDRIVLVPYPVPVAGPEHKQRGKPGPYPRQGKEAWQPRTLPPTKAQKVANFLDSMNRSDQAARDHMTECRRISKELQRTREQVEA